MKSLIQVKNELLITFSWGNFTHGISGHLFECIDYYLVLKNHFDVKILIPEDIKNLDEIIEDKYNLSNKEKQDLLNNVIYGKPVLLRCENILFVDGNYSNLDNIRILAKKIIFFACGDISILEN
jgi:hypothetical protein